MPAPNPFEASGTFMSCRAFERPTGVAGSGWA